MAYSTHSQLDKSLVNTSNPTSLGEIINFDLCTSSSSSSSSSASAFSSLLATSGYFPQRRQQQQHQQQQQLSLFFNNRAKNGAVATLNNSISSNLRSMLMPSMARLTNLIFAPSAVSTATTTNDAHKTATTIAAADHILPTFTPTSGNHRHAFYNFTISPKTVVDQTSTTVVSTMNFSATKNHYASSSNGFSELSPLLEHIFVASSNNNNNNNATIIPATAADHTFRHSSWNLVTHLVDSDIPHAAEVVDAITLCLLSISLIVNLYLCIAIFCARSHRSRTNSLMQNIFVSNLLMVTASFPFKIFRLISLSSGDVTSSHFEPIFGAELQCKIVPSMQRITEFVTAASITILAIDKCQSICAKHNSRITNVFSVMLLTKLIWLMASILSLPTALYGRVTTLYTGYWWSTFCHTDLSQPLHSDENDEDDAPPNSNHDTLHLTVMLLSIVLLYVGPMLITGVAHGKTYLHLFQHRHRYSHVHDLQKRIRKSDREAIRMLSFVASIFAIAWLPGHVVQIGAQWSAALRPSPSLASDYDDDHDHDHLDPHTKSLQTWLWAYIGARQIMLLATCIIPPIYVRLNRSIREQFIDHLFAIVHRVRPSFGRRLIWRQRGSDYGSNKCSTTSNSSASSNGSSDANQKAITSVPASAHKSNSLQKLLCPKRMQRVNPIFV